MSRQDGTGKLQRVEGNIPNMGDLERIRAASRSHSATMLSDLAAVKSQQNGGVIFTFVT
jgi:hypothetical protein